MPLPNHLTGCRPNPPGQTTSSPNFDHTITRQPNRTIYNVYGSSNKRRKDQAGETDPAGATSMFGQSQRNRPDRSARGGRQVNRTTSSSPSGRCPAASNGRTRSATPARTGNTIMSRSAGTGCQPVTNGWIPSAGRFNTSPRTYYSRARTLEAERQAALAAAASVTSSSPSPLPSKIRTTPTSIRTMTPAPSMTSSSSSTPKYPSECVKDEAPAAAAAAARSSASSTAGQIEAIDSLKSPSSSSALVRTSKTTRSHGS